MFQGLLGSDREHQLRPKANISRYIPNRRSCGVAANQASIRSRVWAVLPVSASLKLVSTAARQSSVSRALWKGTISSYTSAGTLVKVSRCVCQDQLRDAVRCGGCCGEGNTSTETVPDDRQLDRVPAHPVPRKTSAAQEAGA